PTAPLVLFSSLRLHPRSTLFPYTTLFRSVRRGHGSPERDPAASRLRLHRVADLLVTHAGLEVGAPGEARGRGPRQGRRSEHPDADRKSTRLNSSHVKISYAVFCLKKNRQM